MHIPLPYHHQHTGFSCGPTSLRMIFDHIGIHYSEEKLIQLCHAVPKLGTSHKHLIEEIRREKLHYREKTSAKISDLVDLLERQYPVLVNYLNPISNNGHYAIVCGKKGGKLILADPSNGKDFYIDSEEFCSHWHNKKHTSQGWMLVVSREKITL